MKTIAILPARCGSKGIPFKNIYPINNKPLISYSIQALQNSMVDEIYVSTDCEQIANISTQYNSKIIHRPPEISTDTSPTIHCIKHAIDYLNIKHNDIILTIQPTSPLIISDDINLAIQKMMHGNYSSVISVVSDHSFLWEQSNEYILPKHHNVANRIRRQDMIPTFKENGMLYATTTNNIKQNNTLYGKKVGYIQIPKSRSFEVDTYEDIKIIEKILMIIPYRDRQQHLNIFQQIVV